jgi:hypothetical protein
VNYWFQRQDFAVLPDVLEHLVLVLDDLPMEQRPLPELRIRLKNRTGCANR